MKVLPAITAFPSHPQSFIAIPSEKPIPSTQAMHHCRPGDNGLNVSGRFVRSIAMEPAAQLYLIVSLTRGRLKKWWSKL
jgi:hypothetical protein